jgi:hypothetical protein
VGENRPSTPPVLRCGLLALADASTRICDRLHVLRVKGTTARVTDSPTLPRLPAVAHSAVEPCAKSG